jgi:citrate synthase
VLSYGGYGIEDLARNTPRSRKSHLLWYGELPDRAQLETLRKRLVEGCTVHDDVLTSCGSSRRMAIPWRRCARRLRAVRVRPGCRGHVARGGRPQGGPPDCAGHHAHGRHRAAPHRPRARSRPAPDLSLAANLLYMLRGEAPDELEERIIDAR